MIGRRNLLLTGFGLIGSFGLTAFAPKKNKPASTGCTDAELCSERSAQSSLPKSADPLWTMLRQCKVSENQKTGMYSIQPTAQVKALAGTTVRAKGFTLPLDGNDKTAHFLIGVNTPVCFYHPPGEPNEVIEVSTKQPITWDEKLTTVEGTFSLMNNGEMGVFFRLTNARQVRN